MRSWCPSRSRCTVWYVVWERKGDAADRHIIIIIIIIIIISNSSSNIIIIVVVVVVLIVTGNQVLFMVPTPAARVSTVCVQQQGRSQQSQEVSLEILQLSSSETVALLTIHTMTGKQAGRQANWWYIDIMAAFSHSYIAGKQAVH